MIASELGGQMSHQGSGQSSEIPACTQTKSARRMFSDAAFCHSPSASEHPAQASPTAQGETYHVATAAERRGEQQAVLCGGSARGFHAIAPEMLFPQKP